MLNSIILIIYFLIFDTSILFGTYQIGDTMTVADQNVEYDICYGEYSDEVFKFADINGSINGGDYKISVVGVSATW